MRASLPPLSLARDPDGTVVRVFDPLAHLGPLGEGWTACDNKERQATPVTLSTGVEVCDATPRHPSPLSMVPQGMDTVVPPLVVYRHHHHPAPHATATRPGSLW